MVAEQFRNIMEKFYNENYDRLVDPPGSKSRIGLPSPVESLIQDPSLKENWHLETWQVSGNGEIVEIRLIWKGKEEERDKNTCCIKCVCGKNSDGEPQQVKAIGFIQLLKTL